MSHRAPIDARADTERLPRDASPSRGSPTIGSDTVVRWKLGYLVTFIGVIVGGALWCYRIESCQSRTVGLLNVLVEIELARGGIPPDQLNHLIEEKSK